MGAGPTTNSSSRGTLDPPIGATHFALGIILIFVALVIQYSGDQYMNVGFTHVEAVVTKARRDVCQTLPSNQSEIDALKKLADGFLPGLNTSNAKEFEKQRILEQTTKAQRIQCLHKELLLRYVKNYYIAVVESMLFGTITAITLLIVGSKGWSTSNSYVLTLLLVSAGISAFFLSFPNVFKQPEMIAIHKAQMLRYEALIDGVASYTASGAVPQACRKKEPATKPSGAEIPFSPVDLIVCLDAALAEFDVPFSLDPGHGPDPQKLLNPAVKPP